MGAFVLFQADGDHRAPAVPGRGAAGPGGATPRPGAASGPPGKAGAQEDHPYLPLPEGAVHKPPVGEGPAVAKNSKSSGWGMKEEQCEL